MVESRTARMRLVQWSSGTDSPQRVDFNETFLNIETLAAIDQQGTYNDRPAPSKTGMYYFATDQGTLYRSDGLSWAVVGASVLSQFVRPARTDAVAQTIQGLASQTADLQRVINSAGVLYQRVRSNGDLIHGPLRVSQAARTATATETVPTDSAVTLDNGSTSMWGLSLLSTTGNTTGFFRAVRGGSAVFSVGPTGVVTTPSVVLTSAPTDGGHATTKSYVDNLVSSTVYTLEGGQISGLLPVSKGGTGRTTAPAGSYLRGNSTGTAFEAVTPSNLRTDIDAASSGHGHSLTDANITGTLPVNQGGTGATTVPAARDALGVPAASVNLTAGAGLSGGGDLTANRTFQVVFEGSGSASTVARSDHGHSLTDANVTGVLPVAQGGTGRSTITSGTYLRGNGTTEVTMRTPAQVLSDIGAAPSVHGHSLTDSNITGVLPVNQGGSGASNATSALSNLGAMPRDVETLPANQNINNWNTTGTWLPAAYSQVTPANGYPTNNSVVFLVHVNVTSSYSLQVVSQAYQNRRWWRSQRNGTWSDWEEYGKHSFTISEGVSASGWESQSGGQVVTPLKDGRFGVSLGVRLLRTGSTFTQEASMMVHGYVSTTYRPTQNASLFPCFIGGTLGMAQINWSNSQFSARTLSGTATMSPGAFIEFSYTWVSNGP